MLLATTCWASHPTIQQPGRHEMLHESTSGNSQLQGSFRWVYLMSWWSQMKKDPISYCPQWQNVPARLQNGAWLWLPHCVLLLFRGGLQLSSALCHTFLYAPSPHSARVLRLRGLGAPFGKDRPRDWDSPVPPGLPVCPPGCAECWPRAAGGGKATVPCVNVNTRTAVFSSQLLVLKREKEHKFTIYLFILVSHEDCDSDTANARFSLYKVNSPSGLGGLGDRTHIYLKSEHGNISFLL